MTYDLKSHIQALLRDPFPDRGLTPRETHVVELMSKGYSSRRTAEILGKSFGTVRKQAFSASKKIGLKPHEWSVFLIHKIEIATKIEE